MKSIINFTICLLVLWSAPLAASQETPPPAVLVIIGATGDLTARKIMPAIYDLAHDGHLPEHFAVVGVARSSLPDDEFKTKAEASIEAFSRTGFDETFWQSFKDKIFFSSLDNLKKRLAEIDVSPNHLFYLATPPSAIKSTIEKLKTLNLLATPARLIIEKPFGHDLDSAITLQDFLSKQLDESQIFRIDHYLGKVGVQNLLTFRFENKLLEPIWNKEHIDHVQITMSEDIGIGTRANFWEETGFLREIFQNHLMQLFALIAMEPPQELTAEGIHAAKINVLNATCPFLDIDEQVIRGQYGPGVVKGNAVIGYQQEEGVAESSAVETFIAAKIFIDNARWQGVPFYIRGGKRLPKRATEIVIAFKNNNALHIRIQPDPAIYLKLNSRVSSITDTLDKSAPEAYERLIYDALRGDKSLFVKVDEQLTAWRLLTPILHHWKAHPNTVPIYKSGTWGPPAADQLLAEDGRAWQTLE